MKNYSSSLEKILMKKPYTASTKNLLSDMLYKIENSYEDFKTVKVDVKTKPEILGEIIEIIEKECHEIEVIKERTSSSNREEGKIITFLNTKQILYEIYQLKKKQFEVNSDYDIIKKSLENTLNQGYSINGSEIIRDFDGWSWNIQDDEIENIINNFIYQTLILLVGNQFLDEWQNSTSHEDYMIRLAEVLEEKYKSEKAEQIIKTICQISILNYTEHNQKEKERLIEMEKELAAEYNMVNDKKQYLKNVSENKMNINKKICSIDEIVSNDRLLKQEFIRRNEVLSSHERIFSLSDFVEVLQNEKADLMKKLNKCNKKMEPLNFVKMKLELENKLKLLSEIKLAENQKNIYQAKVKELIELVCDALKVQCYNATEKQELVDIIYKIRYYKMIPIFKEKEIHEIVNFSEIENYVITNACKMKAINIISLDIQENYEVINSILETEIIKLEKIYIKLIKKSEYETLLEVYDEENKDTTIGFETIKDLKVIENKKFKLFV